MKNLIVNIPVLVLFILFLAGCKKKDRMNIADNRTYQLERQELDVSYGTHALQKMDIYFPEDFDPATPVVFVIHGGGFVAGTKEDFTDRAKLFMARGFVTVNISHRLVNAAGLDQTPPARINSQIKVLDEVNDIAAAVEKYKAVAAGYGSGTSKMYMAGHSAGGTLAMLYVQGDKNINKQVRASGNLAGLANVTLSDDLYNNPPNHQYWPAIKELLHRMSGAEPVKQNALHLMAISPNWVSSLHAPGMPNITVMSNTNDEDLRFHPYFSTIEDARKYHDQLRSKGVPTEFIMMDTDHGFSRHPEDWQTAIKHTTDFFKRN